MTSSNAHDSKPDSKKLEKKRMPESEKALVVQARMPDDNAIDEALDRILSRHKKKIIDVTPVAVSETPSQTPAKPQPAPTPTWFAQNYAGHQPDDLATRYRERLAQGQDALGHSHGHMTADQEMLRKQIEARFQAAKRMAEIQRQNQPTDMRPAFTPPAPKATPTPQVTANRVPRPSARGHEEGLQRFHDWEKKLGRRGSLEPVPQAKAAPQQIPLYDSFEFEERRSSGRGKLAAAVMLACFVGGAGGYFTANQPQVLAFYDEVFARGKAVAVAMAEPQADVSPLPPDALPRETVLTKKPVKIASLNVADVTGALNNPIPLPLSVQQAEPDKPLAVKITGLPADAYLTQGTEIAAGQWLVKPTEFKGLELVVPKASESQLDLSVAAVEENTGKAAAPAQSLTVELDLSSAIVLPASAPPESQSTSQTKPKGATLPGDILARADEMLQSGDVISARQVYLKAHRGGNAMAAFGVAQSFDPLVYDRLGIKGLEPDRTRAVEWYAKAEKAGHAGADVALKALKSTE